MEPVTKKSALTFFSARTSRILGVQSLEGPSSKVSTTVFSGTV
jgi:hypothetical protein